MTTRVPEAAPAAGRDNGPVEAGQAGLVSITGPISSVRDLGQSIAFYEEVVGLEIVATGDGLTVMGLRTRPRQQVIVLRQAKGLHPVRTGREGIGLRGLFFEVSTTDDLDAIEQRLKAHGAFRLRRHGPTWEAVMGYDPDRTEVGFSTSLTSEPLGVDDWGDLDPILHSFGD